MNDILDPEALLNMMEDLEEEKKKAEESEKRYKELVENLNDIIYSVNKEGTIDYMNPIIESLTSYKAEELIGNNFAEFIHPDDLNLLKKSFKDVLTNNLYPSEFRIITKKGKSLWVRSFSRPLIKNKKVIGITGVITDITERKKAELEKEKLQNRLRKYAKRLEIKLKRLEGDRTNLTEKEKLVLWGITRYSLSNDLKLSKRLKIKRSTVTAIRNRLREKRMYEVIMVPDYSKLGAELITFAYGRHNLPYEARTEVRENILEDLNPNYVLTSDNEFLSIYTSRTMVDFQRKTSHHIDMIHKQSIIKRMEIVHFFYSLSNVMRFMDYAPLLKDLFKIKIPEKELKPKENIKIKLTNNDKRVLLKIIEYPELSAYDLSFKVNLTRATIAKIKKKLIKNKIIIKVTMPNAEKLGLGLMMITHIKHGPGVNDEGIQIMLKSNPHIVFLIKGDKESVGISLFKDYSSYKRLKQNMPSHNPDIFAEEPIMFKILTKNIKQQKIDFLSTAKRLLGE